MPFRKHRLIGTTMLALLAAVVPTPATLAAVDATNARPLLATADQAEGERVLLELLEDPELKALQAKIKADLAKTAIGQTPDGAARIDYAVAEWTNSLIFKELISNRSTPAILWGTDDTPRSWLGYTLGGVGTSGDNPDFIYRSATVAGNGRYEIVGQFDPTRRPTQFVLQAVRPGAPVPTTLGKNNADLGTSFTTLTDRDLVVKPDGSFRITIGGAKPADSANHIVTEPGEIILGFRDVLGDWKLRPSKLSIQRLDGIADAPLDKLDVRQRVLAKLAEYITQWSGFPQKWLGGLQPNSIAAPVPREGGWGYLSGIRFQLAPDEAIAVTTHPGKAGYAGIQVVDPWMIASDAKRYQTSLNLSQARPNADGDITYVIAASDAGVANWLDTSGLHEGYAILRWQVLPPDIDGKSLVRDFKVIKLHEAEKLPGVVLSTSRQRKAQLAARADGYTNRTR